MVAGSWQNRSKPAANAALTAALRELAAVAAIEEVDKQADGEPHEEADPIHDGQARHEQDAETDAGDRNDGPAGSAESAFPSGIAIAEDEHAAGDEREGEQRADVGEVGE